MQGGVWVDGGGFFLLFFFLSDRARQTEPTRPQYHDTIDLLVVIQSSEQKCDRSCESKQDTTLLCACADVVFLLL